MPSPALPVLEHVAPALRPHPSRLFVEVTTRCNLRCAMCVKEAPGQRLAEGDMSEETYARLAPAFPGLEALVLNGIGEPLLHPALERFVERARRDMPPAGWIGFQTNAQLLGPRRARALVEAGVDRICMSADAVSPEVFGALRRGGRPEPIEAAARALRAAARERGRPISLGLEFVTMRENLAELPALVRWAARSGVDFILVTHMFPYGQEGADDVAFDTHTAEATALFHAWEARARAAGADLHRYFDVFLKMRPSAEDRLVIEHVNGMVQEATARGLTLRLPGLLRADAELRRRVEETFGEAAALARGAGIDLQLPASAPRNQRRCEFVEEGGAFVSWEGDVHPCYFLWHRYSCHLAGVVKNVQPKSFGNVRDRDLLTLWAEGRAFREGVLRYDFPFCYDCGHALCDFVQDEEFTHDCHLNTVPCAACLWCTGVFQCLH